MSPLVYIWHAEEKQYLTTCTYGLFFPYFVIIYNMTLKQIPQIMDRHLPWLTTTIRLYISKISQHILSLYFFFQNRLHPFYWGTSSSQSYYSYLQQLNSVLGYDPGLRPGLAFQIRSSCCLFVYDHDHVVWPWPKYINKLQFNATILKCCVYCMWAHKAHRRKI